MLLRPLVPEAAANGLFLPCPPIHLFMCHGHGGHHWRGTGFEPGNAGRQNPLDPDMVSRCRDESVIEEAGETWRIASISISTARPAWHKSRTPFAG
ncbi:DUF2933 domain-containing protein [Sphingobium ummariense]